MVQMGPDHDGQHVCADKNIIRIHESTDFSVRHLHAATLGIPDSPVPVIEIDMETGIIPILVIDFRGPVG